MAIVLQNVKHMVYKVYENHICSGNEGEMV
jgi:hypothetical protein